MTKCDTYSDDDRHAVNVALKELVRQYDARHCLAIRDGPNGRGLYARKDVGAGATVLKLPASAMLHVKSDVVRYLLPDDAMPSSERPSNAHHWQNLQKGSEDVAFHTRANGTSDPPPYPLTSVQVLTLILGHWRACTRAGYALDERLDGLLATYPIAYPELPLNWQLAYDALSTAAEGKQCDGSRASYDESARKAAASFTGNLLRNLPSHVAKCAAKVHRRFRDDYKAVTAAVIDFIENGSAPALGDDVVPTAEDIAWAWCSVNSRCIFMPLGLKPHGDNFTLAPLLDMANHTNKPRCEAKVRNLPGRTLEVKAPLASHGSSGGYKKGDEIFLSYGAHSDMTLLTEYGFCLSSSVHSGCGDAKASSPPWQGNPFFEVNVDHILQALFENQGDEGQQKMLILQQEGYWLDYTIHPHPAPAYPSHRLVTALRLLALDLKQPVEIYNKLADNAAVLTWRATVRGMRESVSAANEADIRAILGGDEICGRIVRDAERSIDEMQKASETFAMEGGRDDGHYGFGITAASLLASAKTLIGLLRDETLCARELQRAITAGQSDW